MDSWCVCAEMHPDKEDQLAQKLAEGPVRKSFTERVVDTAFTLYQNRPIVYEREPYSWSDAIDSAIEVVTAESLLEDPLD